VSERVHIRVRHTSNVSVSLFSHSCTNYVCVLNKRGIAWFLSLSGCVKEVSLFKLNEAVRTALCDCIVMSDMLYGIV